MASIEEMIRPLAGNRCEYCRMPDGVMKVRHVFDHIIAGQHGGPSSFSNYAFCCGDCNRHEGPNIAGIDPVTSLLVPLFNPRRDGWTDHFQWNGGMLMGNTPVGRATISVLAINQPLRIAVRLSLRDEGVIDL